MRYLLFALLLPLTGCLMAQYEDDYREIDSLLERGLYRSALDQVRDVYIDAARTRVQDEMGKALGYRVQLSRQLGEDGYQAAINLVREELAEHEDLPVFSALAHLMAGELLHEYAQRNQYRLSDQTELVDATVTDTTNLENYDLRQLIDAAHRHVYRSLALARNNQTALAEIDAVVMMGDEQRRDELPTLYDLLVSRAMDVIGSSLGSLTDERLTDTEELLIPAREFVELDLAARYNTTRGTPRKLMLYQQWLEYRLGLIPSPPGRVREGAIADREVALLYTDLQRLRFLHRTGAPDSLYLAALQRNYDAYAGNALRDRILVEMAEVENDYVRALELLDGVGETDTVARIQADRLRAEITQPSLSLQTLNYYPRNQPLLVQLGYRNVDRVHYRIYAYDPADAGERRTGATSS